MLYLDIGEVYAIHEKMIEIGGGRAGIRDFTLLHSAVERPKASFAGRDLYTNIFLKDAALMHSLIKNHPFADGNKRAGFFSMLRFLNLNGYDIKMTNKQAVEFAVSLHTKNPSLSQIASYLKKHSKKTRI